MNPITNLLTRLQEPYTHSGDHSRKFAQIDQKAMAYAVGLAAVSLPLVMLAGTINPFWVNTTCFRDSISHFYYAPFLGSYFIGILFFIATYLWVYRGEDGKGRERKLASVASLFAFGVAVFPTSGHGCETQDIFEVRAMSLVNMTSGTPVLETRPGGDGWGYFSLFPNADMIHYGSAGLLFAFLTWFAWVVFPAVDGNQRQADGSLTPEKFRRNVIYYVSGAIMLVSVLALLYSQTLDDKTGWNAYNLTFWFEAAALMAFGVSWLIKGGFWGKHLADKK